MEAQRAILFLETVLYTGRMCSSISHCDCTMYIRPVSLMLGASCMLDTTVPTELHLSYFLSALLDLCLWVTSNFLCPLWIYPIWCWYVTMFLLGNWKATLSLSLSLCLFCPNWIYVSVTVYNCYLIDGFGLLFISFLIIHVKVSWILHKCDFFLKKRQTFSFHGVSEDK